MDKRFLSDDEMEQLKLIMKTEQWGVLRDQALEAWKNRCSNKIVAGPDVTIEALGVYASELKYGIAAVDWFFQGFIPELYKEVKVDKKKE